MKKNVGSIDRFIRIILAVILFSLFFFLDGAAKYWGLLGIIPLLTGFISFCPLYSLFGVTTCKTK